MTSTTDQSPIETFTFAGNRMRVIDLSQRLSPATSDIEVMPHRIEYFTHEESAKQVSPGPGLTTDHCLDRSASAYERITLTTHSGTPLDAPYHYGPAGRGGRRPPPMPEVPFRWGVRDGGVPRQDQ